MIRKPESIDGDVVFGCEDPDQNDSRACLDRYFDVLLERFDEPFERSKTNAVDVDSMRPPHGWLMIGRIDGQAVACGALKRVDADVADIKHVWVSEAARGRGVGGGLMTALEKLAESEGFRFVRLDTNRNLVEAVAMYRARGYAEVDAFNDEFYAHHWFIKTL